MKFEIEHLTRYRYDAPLLGECFMEARLRPLSVTDWQTCFDFQLTTEPFAPIHQYHQPEQMGAVHNFIIRGDPHDTLLIRALSHIETLHSNPFLDIQFEAHDWNMLQDPALRARFAEWLAPTPIVPLDVAWDVDESLKEVGVFEYTQQLSVKIYETFEYVAGVTEISTPLSEFIAQKRGVCQDYAHLMLSAARSAGIPSRYVSGYVWPGEHGDTHGAGATHAWVEMYLPHLNGWRGFDPTNNVVVADKHIKIAVGRDYADLPPTKGLLRAARGHPLPNTKQLDVIVRVQTWDFEEEKA